MRLRSPRRAMRRLCLALAASAAPVALMPSVAQEWLPLAFPVTAPSPDAPAVEATRNLTIREFEAGPTPLEAAFFDLPGMSTANVLPERAVLGFFGQNQANPSGAGGTGNQNYFFGADFAISERFQFGYVRNRFADPVTIGGTSSDMIVTEDTVSGAFKVFDNGSLQVTARASAGRYNFASAFHGSRGGADAKHFIGSFHLPMSVEVGGSGQLMFVPGVSIFPDEINGVAMYGVIPQVGVGGTVRLGQRFGFFGLVNVPFGNGGNSFDSVTGAPSKVPVWTAGLRYMATPKAALDFYVTNGFGASPATDILTFIPDGKEPVIGARLAYTPGWSRSYRPNYRGIRDEPPSARELRLQYRGLTMASADTLEAGRILVSAGGGTNGHYQAGFRFSPDHDLEVGLAVEGLPDDGSRAPNRRLGSSLGKEDRWMIQGKIRFFDQNNGSPFSMSANVEIGREWSTRFGVAYGSLPVSYKFSPKVAVMAEPKAAFYGNERLYGVGLGVNAELWRGLDLIAEVTPMANDPVTWAVGSRLHLDALGWYPASIDISASNAIGTRAAGTMVAQDEIRYSVGVHVPLNGRRILNSLF